MNFMLMGFFRSMDSGRREPFHLRPAEFLTSAFCVEGFFSFLVKSRDRRDGIGIMENACQLHLVARVVTEIIEGNQTRMFSLK